MSNANTEAPTNESSLAPVQSLWVRPNGDAYRLRDYSVDLMAEPFTGEKNVPNYTVHYAKGMNSNADTLPEDAVLVWSPTEGYAWVWA